MCEQLLVRQQRKGFLYRIMTGDEKWIFYNNPKRRKSGIKPGDSSISTRRPNIHTSKLDVVYYELLNSEQKISANRYILQLMCLGKNARNLSRDILSCSST